MSQTIKQKIRQLAQQHGFELCAFAKPTVREQDKQAYQQWLHDGMYGDMGYMAEEERVQRRQQPQTMLHGVRTIISVAMRHQAPPYDLKQVKEQAHQCGVIASYAHGDDYHEIMKKALKALASDLDDLLGKHEQRVYVDTAPVLEHALAAESGLGWQGKHSLTIHREFGSYLMLGEIFTTMDLTKDITASAHCGSCIACMNVCPTGAITKPFVVDARLCISYLTIEFRGFIPREIRSMIGNRIYGCDDCQMVCPWNRQQHMLHIDFLQARDENILPSLATLFVLDDDGFRQYFRKSPVKRGKRAGLLRNIAIAMGNSANIEFIPLLLKALDDEEPLVRGHSAWALARLYEHIGNSPCGDDGEIVRQLTYHAQSECHAEVQEEFRWALQHIVTRQQGATS